MKSKIILFLLLLITVTGINAQTDYYWYNGEQIHLEPYPRIKYIVIDDTICEESELLGVLNYPELSVVAINRSDVLELLNIYDSTATEKQFAVVESQDSIDEFLLESNEYVHYLGPYYTYSHYTLGVSNLFNVKLFNEDDIVFLDSLSNCCNVIILGNNKSPYLSLWYTIECTGESVGNALEMANLFYESGYFAHAKPEFIYYNLVDDNFHFTDIKIYPNPAKDFILINNESEWDLKKVELFGINGQTLKSFAPDSEILHLSEFPNGIYMLKIETKEFTKVFKIYISKSL